MTRTIGGGGGGDGGWIDNAILSYLHARPQSMYHCSTSLLDLCCGAVSLLRQSSDKKWSRFRSTPRTVNFLVYLMFLALMSKSGVSIASGRVSSARASDTVVAMVQNSRRVSTASANYKDLFVLRHGQATHNPRAEAARAAGCSFEEFLDWMKQDDSLDSELTELGREQASSVYRQHGSKEYWKRVELVVSSPLSRAIQTADLALPPTASEDGPTRIIHEEFREVNGWLLNAKRRSQTELADLFPHWDSRQCLHHHDDILWDPDELEDKALCGERGYKGLEWILSTRSERSILLVAHGGILRYVMGEHPHVIVRDGRRDSLNSTLTGEATTSETSIEAVKIRSPDARFSNCELRRYRIHFHDEDESCSDPSSRRKIVMTELDLHHNDGEKV